MVLAIGAADRCQQQLRILHIPRHRPQLVARPAQRHRSRPRHPSKRRPHPGHATPHTRAHNRTLRLRPNRKRNESRRHSSPRPRTRSRCALIQVPRVLRLPAKPHIIQRQRPQTQLRNQHRTGIVQPLGYRCIFHRHTVAKRLRSPRRWNPRRIQQVLRAPRNPMQRPAILPSRNLLVRRTRLLQRMIFSQRNHAVQHRLVLLQPFQVDLCQPLGAQLLRPQPLRLIHDGRKCNLTVLAGHRRNRRCLFLHHHPDRYRYIWNRNLRRYPHRRWHIVIPDRKLPRPHPPLQHRGHRLLPVPGSLGDVLRRHLDLHQLLGLRKGLRRYRWPHRSSRPKRRRRPRRLRSRRYPASAVPASAAATRPIPPFARNSLRVLDICPPILSPNTPRYTTRHTTRHTTRPIRQTSLPA